MARLAFIGGGGFAKEALEVAELCGHQVTGYVGRRKGLLDRPFWGDQSHLLDKRSAFDAVVIAFGAVDRRAISRRREVLEWTRMHRLRSQALISPHAVISRDAKVGAGSFVAHGVVVCVGAEIGEAVSLNVGAVIGHDAVIGDNVTVAPAAFLGGEVRVNADGLIGPGALILQGLQIGEQCVVGVGATVLRDLAAGTTVMPNRSRTVRI